MQKYGIPMVNLYKICEMNLQKASNDGIHWKREAYMLLRMRSKSNYVFLIFILFMVPPNLNPGSG